MLQHDDLVMSSRDEQDSKSQVRMGVAARSARRPRPEAATVEMRVPRTGDAGQKEVDAPAPLIHP
jgi:hypothetical protein